MILSIEYKQLMIKKNNDEINEYTKDQGKTVMRVSGKIKVN